MVINMYITDPVIQTNSIFIKNLELSELRLQNNQAFPWLILIPRIVDKYEIFELREDENLLLMKEIRHVSKVLKTCLNADKINVASFGNVVKQLHIHVIARFHHDNCWPQTPWNSSENTPYEKHKLDLMLKKLDII